MPTLGKGKWHEYTKKIAASTVQRWGAAIELIRVEVTGLEPATAWSQTRNATNCATPRILRLQRYEEKLKN